MFSSRLYHHRYRNACLGRSWLVIHNIQYGCRPLVVSILFTLKGFPSRLIFGSVLGATEPFNFVAKAFHIPWQRPHRTLVFASKAK